MNLKCPKISQEKRKLNWDHQFAKLLLKARKSFSNRSQASSSPITRKKVGSHLEKLQINTSRAQLRMLLLSSLENKVKQLIQSMTNSLNRTKNKHPNKMKWRSPTKSESGRVFLIQIWSKACRVHQCRQLCSCQINLQNFLPRLLWLLEAQQISKRGKCLSINLQYLSRIRFSRNFNFSEDTGYGNDLTEEQVDDLKVAAKNILVLDEIDEATITFTSEDCTRILGMTNRTNNS